MSPVIGDIRSLLSIPTPTPIAALPARCASASVPELITGEGATISGRKAEARHQVRPRALLLQFLRPCVEVCPTTALEFSKEYRLAGFSREVAVLDHLMLLQKRQKAAGLHVTPIPTAEEIAAAAAAEAKEKKPRPRRRPPPRP